MKSVEQLKDSLVNYLKSKDEFSDYDFDSESGGINLMMELCTKSAYDVSLNNTMVINEAFIDTLTTDTALFRKSNEIGYNITNIVSSRVTIKIEGKSPINIKIPKYTKFTSIDGSYNFINTEDYVLISDGVNISGIIELVQGDIYDYSEKIYSLNQILRIPNNNIDSTYFDVVLIRDNIIYNLTKSTNTLFNDNNYYRQIVDDGYVEIYGDYNQFQIDDLINIKYIVSEGANANGINNIKTTNLSSITNLSITCIGSSYGGKSSVNINKEKINIKKFLLSQNRAITSNDYETLLYNNFPQFDNIYVYGGENVYPKQYNKVYISVDLGDGQITDVIENNIKSFIDEYNIINIKTEIKQIENLKLNITINSYVSNTINKSANIISDITEAVDNYFTTITDLFSISKLITLINNVDNVESNYITLTGYKTYNPLNAKTFSVDFDNEINTFKTSNFNYNNKLHYIKLVNGQLNLYLSDTNTLQKSNIGTLSNGIININNIIINENVDFNVTFKNNDLKRIRNNKFKKGDLTINVSKL